MSRSSEVQPKIIGVIEETCLCMRVQRAARAVGKRFDAALRPIGLNNWQFSMLVALTELRAPTIKQLSAALGMDRTTVTKCLRPLERDGLVEVRQDADDARARRLVVTDAGRRRLSDAAQLWRSANEAVEARVRQISLPQLRSSLEAIASE